jgi:CubicO group peptidase (beta-lactamase class C family)
MINRFSTIIFLFLFAFTAFSQQSSSFLQLGNPDKLGVSSERLQLLDDHIEQFIKDGHLAGGVFMIAKKGEVVYNKTFGERSPGVSYKENDIFRLASMTKAFTTVSIMQLVENGKLRLDDAVYYYLPEFKEMFVAENINQEDSTYTTRPAVRPITIRQLLTHTSGITYGAFQGGAIGAMYDKYGANEFGLSHETKSTLEMAQTIAEVPLIFEPGERYSYGLNMEVLGAVVEVLSEMTLGEYIKMNILEPLKLQETAFYHRPVLHKRIVPVYTFNEEGKLVVSQDARLDYPSISDRTNFAGGGGMSGTAMDYMVFIQALLDGGEYNGSRILSRKSIDLITSDQMIALNRKGNGMSQVPGITYGLGFSLITEDGRGVSMKSPGTFEWGGYFNTKFFIDPEEELTFVGMTQVVPFPRGDFWDKAYAIIYSSLKN